MLNNIIEPSPEEVHMLNYKTQEIKVEKFSLMILSSSVGSKDLATILGQGKQVGAWVSNKSEVSILSRTANEWRKKWRDWLLCCFILMNLGWTFLSMLSPLIYNSDTGALGVASGMDTSISVPELKFQLFGIPLWMFLSLMFLCLRLEKILKADLKIHPGKSGCWTLHYPRCCHSCYFLQCFVVMALYTDKKK